MIYSEINCKALVRLLKKETHTHSISVRRFFPILKSYISKVHIYYVVVYKNIDIYDPTEDSKQTPSSRKLIRMLGAKRLTLDPRGMV